LSAIVALASNNPGNMWGFGAIAAIFLTGSLLLFCVGILGEYVGRVYDEVRGRPLSLINNVYYADQSDTLPTGKRTESSLEQVFPAA
jgi:dolichol-phosphate mannosyltransferase